MNKKIKILHLEDSSIDSEIVRSLMEVGQIENDYFLTEKKQEYLNILESEDIDIIISDYHLPNYNGNEALKIAREKYSHIPFIFVSGVMGEDAAIIAMLNGATDYVLKNKLDRLVPAIKRAIHEYELVNQRKQAETALYESEKIQNEQIERRASELAIANKELAFQNDEKEKRAAELVLANKELIFQHQEKESRAAELVIANKELVFQNKEKENRTTELIIAYKELALQYKEKEKRSEELIIANKELLFQNEEKEKRAAELVIANKELAFQNEEKEKRAAELIITNKQLVYQFAEREKRTVELAVANIQKAEAERSKHVIEEKNKDITDSINYAKRIQNAILPPSSLIKKHLKNSFILYKPKDIVAGDFYWMETSDDLVIFAACDCTGHGVPGAMISVVCHNALNRAVREFDLKHPAAILDKTTELVIQNFEKSEENIRDGMDISLCAYNKKNKNIRMGRCKQAIMDHSQRSN